MILYKQPISIRNHTEKDTRNHKNNENIKGNKKSNVNIYIYICIYTYIHYIYIYSILWTPPNHNLLIRFNELIGVPNNLG